MSVAALVGLVLLGAWGAAALVYQAPGGRITRGLVVGLWGLS